MQTHTNVLLTQIYIAFWFIDIKKKLCRVSLIFCLQEVYSEDCSYTLVQILTENFRNLYWMVDEYVLITPKLKT